LLDSTGTAQLAVGADATGHWYLDQFGTTQESTSSASSSETYLLVAKIVADGSSTSAGSDQLFLKIFSPDDTIPSSDAGIDWTLEGAPDVNSTAMLNSILIQAGANAPWTIDELRLGTTWASVAVPEPAAGALIGFAALVLRRRSRRHLS
jgi:hypothetical protein